MSTAREKHSACVYRGRIFVAGGDGVNTFEVFNTVSNKFSTLRTLLSIPGCSLMFPVEDFLIVFHGKVVSAFDPTKLTSHLCSSLEYEDWYSRGSVFVSNKEAFFVRDKTVYKYEVDQGVVNFVSHLG